jgi:hypothetical protein
MDITRQAELISATFTVFEADAARIPALTLRGGNALDNLAAPPP